MKNTKTLLTQFWVTVYIISEFNIMKKINSLLTQFGVIIYIISEFNFYGKNS